MLIRGFSTNRNIAVTSVGFFTLLLPLLAGTAILVPYIYPPIAMVYKIPLRYPFSNLWGYLQNGYSHGHYLPICFWVHDCGCTYWLIFLMSSVFNLELGGTSLISVFFLFSLLLSTSWSPSYKLPITVHSPLFWDCTLKLTVKINAMTLIIILAEMALGKFSAVLVPVWRISTESESVKWCFGPWSYCRQPEANAIFGRVDPRFGIYRRVASWRSFCAFSWQVL
jgi:hypothetical protein